MKPGRGGLVRLANELDGEVAQQLAPPIRPAIALADVVFDYTLCSAQGFRMSPVLIHDLKESRGIGVTSM